MCGEGGDGCLSFEAEQGTFSQKTFRKRFEGLHHPQEPLRRYKWPSDLYRATCRFSLPDHPHFQARFGKSQLCLIRQKTDTGGASFILVVHHLQDSQQDVQSRTVPSRLVKICLSQLERVCKLSLTARPREAEWSRFCSRLPRKQVSHLESDRKRRGFGPAQEGLVQRRGPGQCLTGSCTKTPSPGIPTGPPAAAKSGPATMSAVQRSPQKSPQRSPLLNGAGQRGTSLNPFNSDHYRSTPWPSTTPFFLEQACERRKHTSERAPLCVHWWGLYMRPTACTRVCVCVLPCLCPCPHARQVITQTLAHMQLCM